MFRKVDLLKAHVRERFHVTPKDGSPPFNGVLTGVTASNYEFADVWLDGLQAASPLFIDRDNVSYLQAYTPVAPAAVVTNATG